MEPQVALIGCGLVGGLVGGCTALLTYYCCNRSSNNIKIYLDGEGGKNIRKRRHKSKQGMEETEAEEETGEKLSRKRHKSSNDPVREVESSMFDPENLAKLEKHLTDMLKNILSECNEDPSTKEFISSLEKFKESLNQEVES